MPGYTREDLKRLQAMSLDDKIQHSISMIEIFYMREKGACYYSFSGGKDSTVLKSLMEIDYNGSLVHDVPLVFSDTGLEYPEIRKFAMSQPGVEIVRPKMNFVEVLQTYGYPLVSKAVSNGIVNARSNPDGSRAKRLRGEYTLRNGRRSQFDLSKWAPLLDLPLKISDECCKAMKKNPMHIYERSTKRHPITGTTAAESLMRTQSWIGRGCNTYSIQNGRAAKSNPLAPWLEQDVLHYIKRNNIEICSVYGDIVYTDDDENTLDFAIDPEMPLKCTGCQRTGCMFCPFVAHLEKGETRFQRMRRTHPRQYEFMLGGGEWTTEKGRQIWQPTKRGLGFARVFEMLNDIYGKDFIRYE